MKKNDLIKTEDGIYRIEKLIDASKATLTRYDKRILRRTAISTDISKRS